MVKVSKTMNARVRLMLRDAKPKWVWGYWLKIKGYPFEFVAHHSIDSDYKEAKTWSVSEVTSGKSVTSNWELKKDAVDAAVNRITARSVEEIREVIRKSVEKIK
jgi:hypothetical protein